MTPTQFRHPENSKTVAFPKQNIQKISLAVKNSMRSFNYDVGLFGFIHEISNWILFGIQILSEL